ncbi:MAG TPA: uracil phosphoribosyltransferase [Candidatus Sumerlaeota bacterium]|nr:uracil phosphoribosyltransferase [Candidatus Sumerlaeota bacterium]
MTLHVVDHPLIRHKMTIIRNVDTSTKKFREVVNEITLLLAYEATRHMETRRVEVTTPLCPCAGDSLMDAKIVIAPILRAGLGMVQGMLDLLPTASIAHIGLYRDEETFEPRIYYQSMPRGLEGATVFIVDPMLATAGSLSAAVSLVKKTQPARIIAIALIASPEGENRMEKEHPDVDIFVGARDLRLDEKAYIVPGLGDAGDRMFGSYKIEAIVRH